MANTKLILLLQQYQNDSFNPEERHAMLLMMADIAHETEIRSWIDQELKKMEANEHKFVPVNRQRADQIFTSIIEAEKENRSSRTSALVIPLYRRWWAAASLLFLLATGTLLWFRSGNNQSDTVAAIPKQAKTEILPGKDAAILTLADGSKIVLDSLGNSVIAAQNGARVVFKNGQLEYVTAGKTTGETDYNVMTTPKGRVFHLQLADGTDVWLNSTSSIRYPTVFEGKERRVEITGEAYFEVAKNADKPFKVTINNKAEVEVLGTHFNVNAYENEQSMNTTLFEGSVRVINLKKQRETNAVNSVLLKPGQQARITQKQMQVLEKPDLEKTMAWKNGMFNFEDASLEEVLRQVERWYNVEVDYPKGIPEKVFIGKITRDISLNKLLKILEEVGVHFSIDGNKVTVVP